MKEITDAIKARQGQIRQLQSEIKALQQAASALGRKRTPGNAAGPPKAKRKRRKMSAAARKAISERMKKSWAKRKRARR
ncbi:MAG: hypothetical protein CL477_09340 [Acidobacteria bacterium]|jgi:hypothetical protein|nr:hypothetical protein [Acidobacteriota bacterium]MBQ00872.1 hypothetical protein [Acidobacteriota bacterium]MDP7480663.1 hypothetical protein [Vicinamibacterales bacterium]MDP7691517.1 hypothetical protein [Vicinamibacterales bacterium]HJN46818.1 hypothetical protein [Vicinamibacterales bacterium]|tara:strand:+ start:214 stop:450 length:237 start_codon:yes stop_codon:yes gene_type:complete